MEQFMKTWSSATYPNFPKPELLASIVAGELEKPQEKKQRSLASWCVQKLMKTSLKEQESAEGIYLKLLFHERMDILEVCQFLRALEGLPNNNLDCSIKDPLVIQKLCEQNLRGFYHEEIRIEVLEDAMKLYLDGVLILDVPQENLYDFHWASVLGRIALKKEILQIDIITEQTSGMPYQERVALMTELMKNFPMISEEDDRWDRAVRQERLQYTVVAVHSLQFYANEWADMIADMNGGDRDALQRIYWPEE